MEVYPTGTSAAVRSNGSIWAAAGSAAGTGPEGSHPGSVVDDGVGGGSDEVVVVTATVVPVEAWADGWVESRQPAVTVRTRRTSPASRDDGRTARF